MLLHFGLFLVLFSGFCLSADVSVNNGGIYLEVFRETGQVKIGYQSNLTADSYSIAFQVTEITELDANMGKLGNESGTYNHTFTSFVNVTTFSNIIDTYVNNISAKFFSMYLTLENGAVFQIAVTVFGASGTVNTASGQTITVAAGNILLTSNLTMWKFCGIQDYCMLNNATGDFIDVTLTFTSPSAFSSKTHNVSFVSKYSLGGNSMLYFPTKYSNGNQTAFPNSYPMIAAQTVKLRYMRFAAFAEYSFAVDMGSNPNGGSTSGERHTTKMSPQALFVLFALTLIGKPLIL